jgi:hypothetical protein
MEFGEDIYESETGYVYAEGGTFKRGGYKISKIRRLRNSLGCERLLISRPLRQLQPTFVLANALQAEGIGVSKDYES